MTGYGGLSAAIAVARSGDRVRALDMLAVLLRADPRNVAAWLWMSQVVDTNDARGFCLQRVLALQPDHSAARAGLAHLQRLAGEQQAREISRQDPIQLAIHTLRKGQVAQARAQFRYLAKSDPSDEQAWLWLSTVAGSKEEQVRCLQAALGANPTNQATRAALELLDERQTRARAAASAAHRRRQILRGSLMIGIGLSLLALALILIIPDAARATPSSNQATLPLPHAAPLPTVTHPTPVSLPMEPSPPAPPTLALTALPGPGRLQIPDLGLDEQVVVVPVRDGSWDITQLNANVGWLESTGRMPGDELAMVLIGHVTLSATRNGPFFGVRFLRPGDQITYSWGGSNYVFAVQDVTTVSPQQVDRLYVHDGDTLLLVSCTDWSFSSQDYVRRTITRAILVPPAAPTG